MARTAGVVGRYLLSGTEYLPAPTFGTLDALIRSAVRPPYSRWLSAVTEELLALYLAILGEGRLHLPVSFVSIKLLVAGLLLLCGILLLLLGSSTEAACHLQQGCGTERHFVSGTEYSVLLCKCSILRTGQHSAT